MSKHQKLLLKFKGLPRDFTWQEMSALLFGFGYEEQKGGKTGGSRVRFVHPTLPPITLHRPHPGNEMKKYQLEQVRDLLSKEGIL